MKTSGGRTYKAVSSGLPGLPVRDHHRLIDVPEGFEVLPQRGVVGVVRQAADEDLGESGVLLKRRGRHDFQGSVHVLMKKHWSAGEYRATRTTANYDG